MRALLIGGAFAALSCSVPAQVVRNAFHKWDFTTEFTSRGGNGSSAGHVSQGFANGFAAGLETLTSVRYVIQDQDLSTVEPWDVGTTGLDTRGEPDYAKLRAYASNLRLSPGSGIGAFFITHTPLGANPHKVGANNEQWHHVWKFVQGANWTTDGLSTHMSEAAPWQNTVLCATNPNGTPGHRELPRTDGSPPGQINEELAWTNQAGNSRPGFLDRAWRLELWFSEITLNGAAWNAQYNKTPCPDPNFGYMSLDPDFADIGQGSPARLDGYQLQVNAGPAFAGGAGVLFWSGAALPAGGVPTPFGRLYIDITDPLFAVGPIPMPPLDSLGTANFDGLKNLGAANGVVRQVMSSFPHLSWQGAVINKSAEIRLTSIFSFRPLSLPTGWTAAQAAAGSAVSLTKTISQVNIVVRNDGRGMLSVQAKRGSTNIGPAVAVAERTAVRVVLSAAANAVEISSQKSTPTRFIWAWNK